MDLPSTILYSHRFGVRLGRPAAPVVGMGRSYGREPWRRKLRGRTSVPRQAKCTTHGESVTTRRLEPIIPIALCGAADGGLPLVLAMGS